ncbi:hypothetical protein SEPCBS119000_004389 [Sporothrix epigloea]|uniref:Uncharacterized protein n=1 Tax=Sporothrix epigloea TaxID=1892477 RepID=A0ABP0DRU9_9PEZI
MATSMPWLPFPFGPQVPVTPPDHQTLPNSQGLPPLTPALLESFTRELYGNGKSVTGNGLDGGFATGFKAANYQAKMMAPQRPAPGSVAAGVNGGAKRVFPSPPPAPLQRQQYEKQHTTKCETKEGALAGLATTPAASSTATPSSSEQATTNGPASTGLSTAAATAATATATAATTTAHAASGNPLTASDPRYLVMASRIAAYYHQRCLAVANFQQQRCQAWANMQRQKSQEMSQAAMLVVAWYIRDRIQRRRRRGRRQFRRGLAAKAAIGNKVSSTRVSKGDPRGVAARTSDGRITRGEAVRKWVLQIPEGSDALSANSPGVCDRPADPDEVSFDLDRDTASDKDLRLYNVADNLIKSQLARIDVPMMGALSFEPSDSETDSDENDDEEQEDEAEDDEPVGPGGFDEEDDIMINYEERGAPLGAVAAGVEALATGAKAKATGASLGAGAAVAVSGGREVLMRENDNNYDLEDDEFEDDDDDDYDDEDDCSNSHKVSDLAHHGTGAGSRRSREETASFA